ncbi:bile acid:sodium symporter family protein [Aliishimia ponticola]|uniref:Bile acid:sodium symporter family protein n=1 Tax=Aliishimia ponticola TaxID=2499833 RepID=A0A4S4NI94_9RHOB|nr:bile acid:sodium symporter [Aliishimia ponticola]THH35820.1 bile acid:sodium symporter family protein [Aliishimia ponticola]
MDTILNIGLPVALAIIMLSLGVGLTMADFRRVTERRRAFGLGAFSQIIMVPLTAYLIIRAFGITGELAVGIMLLSFCPGGVTSNIITKLSRGDVALSVSLTAVVSLLSVLTVPALAAWAVLHFIGTEAPRVSAVSLGVTMFLITTLPVALGVALRHFASGITQRIEPLLSGFASVLFVLMVIGALAGNWDIFTQNLASLGPALIGLNAALMLIGLGLAALAGLSGPERKTVSVETGIQNAGMAITLAGLIAGTTSSAGLSTIALPAGVYGITMYLVALPFLFWFRSK